MSIKEQEQICCFHFNAVLCSSDTTKETDTETVFPRKKIGGGETPRGFSTSTTAQKLSVRSFVRPSVRFDSFCLTLTAASLSTFDVTVTIRTINVFDNGGVTFQARQEKNAM